MQAHLADGLSAAEAAQAVLAEARPARPADEPIAAGDVGVAELSRSLREALDAFDEPAAQAVLDRLLSDLSLPTVLRDVVMPYLARPRRRAGRTAPRASRRSTSPASSSAAGWPAWPADGAADSGPRAVLACPPWSCTTWR